MSRVKLAETQSDAKKSLPISVSDKREGDTPAKQQKWSQVISLPPLLIFCLVMCMKLVGMTEQMFCHTLKDTQNYKYNYIPYLLLVD